MRKIPKIMGETYGAMEYVGSKENWWAPGDSNPEPID